VLQGMRETPLSACAVAAGAATIYRNYYAMVSGYEGQTKDRQFVGLADLGSAISVWSRDNRLSSFRAWRIDMPYVVLPGCKPFPGTWNR
jgi:hypothetical protein